MWGVQAGQGHEVPRSTLMKPAGLGPRLSVYVFRVEANDRPTQPASFLYCTLDSDFVSCAFSSSLLVTVAYLLQHGPVHELRRRKPSKWLSSATLNRRSPAVWRRRRCHLLLLLCTLSDPGQPTRSGFKRQGHGAQRDGHERADRHNRRSFAG
jgi:hypothetical protein